MVYAEERYPDIDDTFRTHWRSKPDECEGARIASFLAMVLKCHKTGQNIVVGNTHLYYKNEEMRTIQAQVVKRRLAEIAHQVSRRGPQT